MDGIVKKYRPELLEPPAPPEESGVSGSQDQQIAEKNDPKLARPQDKDGECWPAIPTICKRTQAVAVYCPQRAAGFEKSRTP